MQPVTFTVSGTPRAKRRPIIDTRGKRRRAITPKVTADWERVVKFAALEAMQGRRRMHGAVEVRVLFSLNRPKKSTMTLPLKHSAVNPDLDNMLKAVVDAMNGVVYDDDAQVVSFRAHKRYCCAHEFVLPAPGVTVVVLPLDTVMARQIIVDTFD